MKAKKIIQDDMDYAPARAQLPDWEKERLSSLLIKLCLHDKHAGMLARQFKSGEISVMDLLKKI